MALAFTQKLLLESESWGRVWKSPTVRESPPYLSLTVTVPVLHFCVIVYGVSLCSVTLWWQS